MQTREGISLSIRRRWAAVGALALVGAALCVTAATASRAVEAAATGYKPAGSWGKTGTANGQFASNGGGIAVDRAGNVYVADSDNQRVQVFSAKGAFLRKWGSLGTGDGQFGRAEDVAVAPDGTVVIADDPNGRFEAFSSSGAYRTSVAAPTGELARGVAVDVDGNVLGSVEGSEQGGFHRFAKAATGWDAPGPLLGGQNLMRADDIEASPDGSIYVLRVSSQGGSDQIQRFSAAGQRLGTWRLGGGDGTRGIGVDPDCNVLAPDSASGGGFAKYSPTGKKLATGKLPYVARDLAAGPHGDVYALIQAGGVAHLAEDRSPRSALVSSVVVSGGVAKVKYTLAGVACPSQVTATASLAGKGVSGRASVKVAAGKTTVLSIPVKAARGTTTATFRIVLKTNGRPTTETRNVAVTVR